MPRRVPRAPCGLVAAPRGRRGEESASTDRVDRPAGLLGPVTHRRTPLPWPRRAPRRRGAATRASTGAAAHRRRDGPPGRRSGRTRRRPARGRHLPAGGRRLVGRRRLFPAVTPRVRRTGVCSLCPDAALSAQTPRSPPCSSCEIPTPSCPGAAASGCPSSGRGPPWRGCCGSRARAELWSWCGSSRAATAPSWPACMRPSPCLVTGRLLRRSSCA
jgi:hypothetical protein